MKSIKRITLLALCALLLQCPAWVEEEAPETAAPAPVTEAPVTEAPVTEVPVTEPPITETPITDAPVITEVPQSTETPEASEAPATSEPEATKKPSSKAKKTVAPRPTRIPDQAQPLEEGETLPQRLMLVNKNYNLSKDYVPEDLVQVNIIFKDGMDESAMQMSEPAARALERMFSAAWDDGIVLVGISGYRSYSTQDYIYNTRLQENGLEHVSKYNAKPGQSEHQTGLAMDVCCWEFQSLVTDFQLTDAYRWMLAHCAEYGFIVRYREGLEEETGYAFEPWHMRYVGEAAQEIMETGVSLEAYLEAHPELAESLPTVAAEESAS